MPEIGKSFTTVGYEIETRQEKWQNRNIMPEIQSHNEKYPLEKRSRAAVKSPTFRSSCDNTRLTRPAAYPHWDGGPMQRFFASPPLIQSVSEAELVLRWWPSTVTGREIWHAADMSGIDGEEKQETRCSEAWRRKGEDGGHNWNSASPNPYQLEPMLYVENGSNYNVIFSIDVLAVPNVRSRFLPVSWLQKSPLELPSSSTSPPHRN
jgi:hypothetical protein